jgi:arsenate reductase
MTKERILFVCIHNSARSQMAEAFMNELCGDDCEAESAGLEPGVLNPIVVEALQEVGIDIAGKPTRDVFEVWKSGKLFNRVITVCDEASAEHCPIFPGAAQKEHWGFADPASFVGTQEEKLAKTRVVRDTIRARIAEWCGSNCVVTLTLP